jgi:Rrf2 family protein
MNIPLSNRLELWIQLVYNCKGEEQRRSEVKESLKYSKATNYALHTMLYLVAAPHQETIGVQALAQLQQISPTYLSKVLSKLVKAGLIESVSGVNGGYRLIGPKEEVSFLAVIEAIEGKGSLFNCGLKHTSPECLIQQTMFGSEIVMEHYLQQKKLVEVVQQLDQKSLATIREKLS